MPPVIYNLAADYARYGLRKSQADAILDNRFTDRMDRSSGTQGRPRCIVLHIQEGTTPGSLSWWSVHDASSTVMVQRDGSILRVIDEKHGPWTNGDVNKPSDKGRQVTTLGGNANIWSLTIEAEGHANDNMPDAQLDAIEWQVREWMKRWNIPANMVLRHADLNSVTRGFCPGFYYVEIMRRINAGEQDQKPQYAAPDVPDWMTEEELAKGIDRKVGPQTAYACRRLFTVRAVTPRYRHASVESPKVGPDLKPGEQFIGHFLIRNKGESWVLTRWGTRVRMKDLAPQVNIG